MVHAFRMGALRLALDVESGAFHSLSEAAFCVLEKMLEEDAAGGGGVSVSPPPALCESRSGGCDTDTPPPPTDVGAIEGSLRSRGGDSICLQDDILFRLSGDGSICSSVEKSLRSLINNGLLFSPSNNARIHTHMRNRVPLVKALCLHMAHECNLRCAYCFAGQGNYGEGDRGLMPLEVGKKALDFLIAQSGGRRNLEVDFFGGEPMLNFDVVKALVAYGRVREVETNKRFRFTLTTNGAFLSPENIPYIHENFDNVVMSLDGRESVNDRMRGVGTYGALLPKIRAMTDVRGDASHYVRGTYTRHNLDFAADVLHMADLGFKYLSVEPVVAPPSEEYALRAEDLPILFAEYEKLAEELYQREREGKGVRFFHFDIDLEGGPCIAKRVTGCGAGSEYLAVTPSGRLFPCHQFVGDEAFCLGDLDSGVLDTGRVREFSHCHVNAKPECADCWAKYYCSGGCMATAYYANGSIMQPDEISCALMRKRIECALYLAARRALE